MKTWITKWVPAITVAALLVTGCSAQPEPTTNSSSYTPAVTGSKHTSSKSSGIKQVINKDQMYLDYLKQNKAGIDLTGRASEGLALLEGDLDDHRLFLTGEAHHVSFNTDLQIAMLGYLHEKAGVRYYMGELPFSMAQMINMYLDTGDEKFFPLFTEEDKRLWQWVYAFNQKLPKEERISVHGMDVEHNPIFGLVYLQMLLEPLQSEVKSVPDEVRPFLKAIRTFTRPESKEQTERLRKKEKEMLQRVEKELKLNLKRWEKTLDADTFFRFRMTLTNLINGAYLHTFYESDHPRFDSEREPMMFKNFQEIDKQISRQDAHATYYGEWGMEHVYQKEHFSLGFKQKYQPRIAQLINEYEPFQGQVLSVGMMYAGSEGLDLRTNKTFPINSGLKDMGLVGPLWESEATLYKLNGTHSPFEKAVKFVDGHTGGSTLDYMQYIVLIRKSPASKPISKGGK